VIDHIRVHPSGQGLYEFTRELSTCVLQAEIESGLCTAFVQHTSASLVIQENADPSVQQDLERWLARLVPEQDALYTHTQEGPDDMPAHVKSALTATSLSIPVANGQLALGTWQGIFLWEHRHDPGTRTVVVHIAGD
jgi:secondary thiamine-phosphate synthase enzyme